MEVEDVRRRDEVAAVVVIDTAVEAVRTDEDAHRTVGIVTVIVVVDDRHVIDQRDLRRRDVPGADRRLSRRRRAAVVDTDAAV